MNRGFAVIEFLVGIAVISLIGLGIYVYINKPVIDESPSTVAPTPEITNEAPANTPIPSPIPTPLPELTEHQAYFQYTLSADNWREFPVTSAEKNSFSISLPSGWNIQTSTFNDASGNKQGEFAGLLQLKNGQTCYDNYVPYNGPGTDAHIEYIGLDEVSFSGKTFMHLENLVTTGNVKTYSHAYCYSQEQKAILIYFYSENPLQDTTLYEYIVSTVRFS